MTPIQNLISAPVQFLGWLWTTIVLGWKTGEERAEKQPLRIPRQLTRIVHPSKIEAIKTLRGAIPGLGLKEAKDACDYIEGGKPYVLPPHVSEEELRRLGNVFEIQGQ